MPAPTELAISNAGKLQVEALGSSPTGPDSQTQVVQDGSLPFLWFPLQGNKENEMIPVSNTHAPLDSCKPEPSDFLIQPGVVTSSPQPAKNTKAVVSAPTSTRKSGRQRKPRIVYVNGQVPTFFSNSDQQCFHCFRSDSGFILETIALFHLQLI